MPIIGKQRHLDRSAKKKEHLKRGEETMNKNEQLKFLTACLGNLGVVGLGLSCWEDGSLYAFVFGLLCLYLGYTLSGRIE